MARILVIEDEASLRENVLDILRFEDYEAVGAPDGRIGLQLVHEYLPDLILCDVIMPELDGYSVLLELRRQPSTAEIPFIFLTARATKTDLRTGMELGAEDYLTKPFTQGELLAAVRTQLEKRETRTRLAKQDLEDLRERILMALPHELRTPLAGIMGYATSLSSSGGTISPEEVVHLGQDIYRNAARLHQLIENYLVYVQLEVVGQDPAWLERLRRGRTADPHALITSCAQTVAQSKDRARDLSLDVGDGPPICIYSDYLKKAVEELVENAFKFSAVGTLVGVLALHDRDSYIVEIRDQGCGMTLEQISQVGAYMQFDRKQREQQGSGMGLIIAKRLVELHAGQLAIESLPNQGTTVRLTLPVATG
jgi:two-component system, sensor histidine kinase and response regulator